MSQVKTASNLEIATTISVWAALSVGLVYMNKYMYAHFKACGKELNIPPSMSVTGTLTISFAGQALFGLIAGLFVYHYHRLAHTPKYLKTKDSVEMGRVSSTYTDTSSHAYFPLISFKISSLLNSALAGVLNGVQLLLGNFALVGLQPLVYSVIKIMNVPATIFFAYVFLGTHASLNVISAAGLIVLSNVVQGVGEKTRSDAEKPATAMAPSLTGSFFSYFVCLMSAVVKGAMNPSIEYAGKSSSASRVRLSKGEFTFYMCVWSMITGLMFCNLLRVYQLITSSYERSPRLDAMFQSEYGFIFKALNFIGGDGLCVFAAPLCLSPTSLSEAAWVYVLFVFSWFAASLAVMSSVHCVRITSSATMTIATAFKTIVLILVQTTDAMLFLKLSSDPAVIAKKMKLFNDTHNVYSWVAYILLCIGIYIFAGEKRQKSLAPKNISDVGMSSIAPSTVPVPAN